MPQQIPQKILKALSTPGGYHEVITALNDGSLEYDAVDESDIPLRMLADHYIPTEEGKRAFREVYMQKAEDAYMQQQFGEVSSSHEPAPFGSSQGNAGLGGAADWAPVGSSSTAGWVPRDAGLGMGFSGDFSWLSSDPAAAAADDGGDFQCPPQDLASIEASEAASNLPEGASAAAFADHQRYEAELAAKMEALSAGQKTMMAERLANADAICQAGKDIDVHVAEKILPNLVTVETREGSGSGFFRHGEWLVTNAHVLKNTTLLDDMIVFDFAGNRVDFSLIQPFHRDDENPDTPDLVVLNGDKADTAASTGLAPWLSEGERSRIRYFYVKPDGSPCFLRKLSKEGMYPDVFLCEDGSEPQPGESGSPVFEACVTAASDDHQWESHVVGALYARCSPEWCAEKGIDVDPGGMKLLCSVPIDADFKQILDTYKRPEQRAERAELTASVVEGTGMAEEQLAGHVARAADARAEMDRGLQAFEEGVTELNITLPPGLEKLVKLFEFVMAKKTGKLTVWMIHEYLKQEADPITQAAALAALLPTIKGGDYIDLGYEHVRPACDFACNLARREVIINRQNREWLHSKIEVEIPEGLALLHEKLSHVRQSKVEFSREEREKVGESSELSAAGIDAIVEEATTAAKESLIEVYKVLVYIGINPVREGLRLYPHPLSKVMQKWFTQKFVQDHFGADTVSGSRALAARTAARRTVSNSTVLTCSEDPLADLSDEVERLQGFYRMVYKVLKTIAVKQGVITGIYFLTLGVYQMHSVGPRPRFMHGEARPDRQRSRFFYSVYPADADRPFCMHHFDSLEAAGRAKAAREGWQRLDLRAARASADADVPQVFYQVL